MESKNNISDCPPNLDKLIKEANSLPKDYTLPSSISVFFFGGAYTDSDSLPLEQRRQMFADTVRNLPEEFIKAQSWVWKVINRQTVTFDKSFKNSPHKMYRQLYKREKDSLKSNLWIETELLNENEFRYFFPIGNLSVDFLEAISNRKRFSEIIEWNKLTERKKYSGFPLKDAKRFRAHIREGVISIELDVLLNTVIEEKIDTRRLLECPSCSNIVWKKQITAKTCGEEKCVQQQKYLKKKLAEESNRRISEQRTLERREWNNLWNVEKGEKKNGTV